MPGSVHVVLKTTSLKPTKPEYEVYDIVPHHYRSSLSANTPERPSPLAYTYGGAHVAHQTEHIEELFHIRFRWAHDPFATLLVPVWDNDKAAASRKMDKVVDQFVKDQGPSATIKRKFDTMGNLVWVEGLKTKKGEKVWFEVFELAVRPTISYHRRMLLVNKYILRDGRVIFDIEPDKGTTPTKDHDERTIGEDAQKSAAE